MLKVRIHNVFTIDKKNLEGIEKKETLEKCV